MNQVYRLSSILCFVKYLPQVAPTLCYQVLTCQPKSALGGGQPKDDCQAAALCPSLSSLSLPNPEVQVLQTDLITPPADPGCQLYNPYKNIFPFH